MIIATAGHVDHGKSTLVRLATGMEPDRWVEERERGLTIDLGFAWTTLDSGRTVGIVDVPGHERFIRNMLAGCGSVDAAMLVVSAAEGWKPQTEEHLQILDLLGLEHGIVVLTHADRVQPGELAGVRDAIRDRLRRSFLDNADLIALDATSATSASRLRGALDRLLATIPDELAGTRPRLWIDRSFVIHGAGRIITGTLTGGTINHGESLELISGADTQHARIRALRVNGSPATIAHPGNRVAVNIAGPKDPPGRGDALAHWDQWTAGRYLHATLRLTRGRTDWPRPRGSYSISVGTTRSPARLRYIDPLDPADKSRLVRIHANRSLAPLTCGDHYILRDEGTSTTVGGGTILAVDAHSQEIASTALRARALTGTRADPACLAAQLLEEQGGATTGVELRYALGTNTLGGTTQVGDYVILDRVLAERQSELLARASSAEPVRIDEPISRAIARQLEHEGRLRLRSGYAEANCNDADSGRLNEASRRVSAVLADHDPPLLRPGEIQQTTGMPHSTLAELVQRGDLIHAPPFLLAAACFANYARAVRQALVGAPKRVTELRAAVPLSRKYLIPLLETMDTRRITHRTGDQRVLGR